MKPKREDGRAARSAPARSPRRAGKPSHGAVTPEELDAARYIAGMTAKLEAVAITARLDRLVYFLGMARVESEIFARTHGAEGAEGIRRVCRWTAPREQFVRLRIHPVQVSLTLAVLSTPSGVLRNSSPTLRHGSSGANVAIGGCAKPNLKGGGSHLLRQ